MGDFKPQNFDFDAWARLAERDPEAFEARRRMVIDSVIRNAPVAGRARLQGLQFRIDMERRRARTPLAACLRLSDMMWHSLLGPRGLKDSLNQLVSSPTGLLQPPPREMQSALARVIRFPARMQDATR